MQYAHYIAINITNYNIYPEIFAFFRHSYKSISKKTPFRDFRGAHLARPCPRQNAAIHTLCKDDEQQGKQAPKAGPYRFAAHRGACENPSFADFCTFKRKSHPFLLYNKSGTIAI